MSDRRWEVSYVSPEGREWLLTSREWIAGLKFGGITGLIGTAQPVTFSALGEPGQWVAGFTVPPASGALEVLVRSENGLSASEQAVQFTHDFRSVGTLGTLIIATPAGLWRATVRLDGHVSEPQSDNPQSDVVTLRIPLAVDAGVWLSDTVIRPGGGSNSRVSELRRIQVANPGEVTVWPRVRWTEQTMLTVPSGAVTELPFVPSERVLSLKPRNIGGVTDANGVVDRVLSEQLRRRVFPEGVLPGETAEYGLGSDAKLEWEIGVLNPWR